MKNTFQAITLLLVALSLFITVPASAEIITLTLDDVSVEKCGETWIEAGVELSFVPTTDEDCTPDRCYFGLDPDRVWLWPARLNLNLSGLVGHVTQVEVDIIDYCRVGCTRAFLYDGALTVDSVANSLVSDPETLILYNDGASVDRAAVSSCEGTVLEIRITLETGPGYIEGLVTDVDTAEPLERALVIAIQLPSRDQFLAPFTDGEGYYDISDLAAGLYLVLAIKRGYNPGVRLAKVIAGEGTWVEFWLTPKLQ
jgi:hypothetical protein